MKDDPGVPGSPLTSKPTWSNTLECSTTSAFFFACESSAGRSQTRRNVMIQSKSTVAEQIARAASTFEERRTGHAPRSVTVVLTDNTLVITLHGALSEAEKAVAKEPAGAAKEKEYHRQLFDIFTEWLQQENKRIHYVVECVAAAD